jgi:hypothetical protein
MTKKNNISLLVINKSIVDKKKYKQEYCCNKVFNQMLLSDNVLNKANFSIYNLLKTTKKKKDKQ